MYHGRDGVFRLGEEMKVLLSAFVLAGAFHAFGSFEVLMVSDSGTDSIHRFDPITGSYFGSFGGGFLRDPVGVVADGSGNAYIYDANRRLSVWNSSTGEYITSFDLVSGGTSLTRNGDGTLNVALSDRVIRYSTTGTTLATYVRQGTNKLYQGIQLADGLFYTSSYDGPGQDSYEWFNYATGASVGRLTSWAQQRVANLSSGIYNTVNVFESTTSLIYEKHRVQGAGPNSFANFSDNTLTNPAGVAGGHGGLTYVVGQVRAAPTTGGIMRWDRNSMVLGTMFGNNIIKTPTGMASIIAPEPASLLALGLGALAVMRRRKTV